MGTIAISWRPASVVCKLFHISSFFSETTGPIETKLSRNVLGWSSTKFLFFVPVGYSTWLPGPIICSDWLKFQRSTSLKLMNWLNPNWKWMIIGMSFTKFLFFYADRKFKMATTAGHRLTLDPMGKCSNAFFSETTNMIIEDRPMNIHVQFGFNHICSFWEEGIWTFSYRVQC